MTAEAPEEDRCGIYKKIIGWGDSGRLELSTPRRLMGGHSGVGLK